MTPSAALRERETAQVGDADLDAAQGGRVDAGGLPAGQRLGQQRLHLVGGEGHVHRRGGRGRGRQLVVPVVPGQQEVGHDVLPQAGAGLLADDVVELEVDAAVDPALTRFHRRRLEAVERPGDARQALRASGELVVGPERGRQDGAADRLTVLCAEV